MFSLQWVEPIFVLTESQRQVLTELEQYEVYFCMLRHEYLENSVAISTMVDFFYYLYEKEQLLFNSEMTMYYLLRHYCVEFGMDLERLRKTKHYTTGFIDRSLIAAALITNMILDIHRKIRPQFTNEEIQFMWKYMKRPKKLFDMKFQKFESYPKKYVLLETRMLQAMRTYIQENMQEIHEATQYINRFMDAYVYDEQQLFCQGILK